MTFLIIRQINIVPMCTSVAYKYDAFIKYNEILHSDRHTNTLTEVASNLYKRFRRRLPF